LGTVTLLQPDEAALDKRAHHTSSALVTDAAALEAALQYTLLHPDGAAFEAALQYTA
jgi:uncharacterized surface protein with fasciclin (FAS1) repeats